jgi:hypothetical protein
MKVFLTTFLITMWSISAFAQDFCSELVRAVDFAKHGFSDIKGARQPNVPELGGDQSPTYDARFSMGRFTGCDLSEDEDRPQQLSLSCSYRQPRGSCDGMSSIYKDAADQFQSCVKQHYPAAAIESSEDSRTTRSGATTSKSIKVVAKNVAEGSEGFRISTQVRYSNKSYNSSGRRSCSVSIWVEMK